MCGKDSLQIDLKSIKEAQTAFNFRLGNDYFEAVGGDEVERGDVSVSIKVRKITDRYFELDFAISGTLLIPCDRCLDDMEQPIETEEQLVVKLGNQTSEDDNCVVIDENDGVIDTSWYIYEYVALAIPIKHVHEDGKCNSEMIALIEQHSANQSTDNEPIDSRWSALSELKSKIKQ